MKCIYCGANLEDGSEFCGTCGNKINVPKTGHFTATPEEIELATQSWTSVTGVEMSLPFDEKEIIITADRDKFNTFRKRFISLAKYCSDRAAEEFIENVYNLPTFLEYFPDLYLKHARVLADKVTDILVAENVYTLTDDMIVNAFDNAELSVMDYLNSIGNIIDGMYQTNNQAANMLAGLASSLIGSKSSVGGEIFGAMQEGIVSDASYLSEAQQKQVLESVDTVELFNRVYNDYQYFAIILVDCLNMNGVDAWKPDFEPAPQMDNILKNLSNPNFPQDKITDIVINMIFEKPYKPEIYSFLQKKYPDSEEVKQIVEYFGFDNYKDLVYTQEDFPKPQPVIPEVHPESEVQPVPEAEPQTEAKAEPKTEPVSQPDEQSAPVQNNGASGFGGFKKLGEKIDQGLGKAESFLNRFGKK